MGSCHIAQGDTHSITFKEDTFFYGQFISGIPEVACYMGGIFNFVRAAIQCESVDCCMYWVSLDDL